MTRPVTGLPRGGVPPAGESPGATDPGPAPFFVRFIYRLRDFGVPVGVSEALTLAQALRAGLHESSLDGFYNIARAILIHHEGHLDAFDQAFLAEFTGADIQPPEIGDELLDWLRDAIERTGDLDEEALRQLEDLDLAELERMLAERLAEQTERHDGGNYWVGTGGTSPFGHSGAARPGIRIGGPGGNRSALRVADARQYRGYRSDVTLDVRQMEVALRRLRSFIREGADEELDIAATIDQTARNAGDIEIVTRPPSRPNTHVIVMIDVGGSMYPYSDLMSRLFSATKRATHFKELRTYYFHNCVYGAVYETEQFTDPKLLPELLGECGSHYKLIMVGDALMAPYELHSPGGNYWGAQRDANSGYDWLRMLESHFSESVWLNPEPEATWPGTTIQDVAGLFEMFPLTVDGLTAAMTRLNRGGASRL